MLWYLSIIFFSFFSFINIKSSEGQNLITNGSFEQLSSCNNLGGGGIDSVIGWWDINTADAFNTCSVGSSVPNNSYGYQVPFDGNGYAFFGTYWGLPVVDYREYAQTKLNSPLQSGIKYYVAFRISFANNFQFASDGIGVFLSMDTVYGSGTGLIVDSIPQVEVPVGIPIVDSVNWSLISGSFIAKGGENYLTIGNFKHDGQLTLQDLGGSANTGGYFLDGVCVSPDSLTCYNFVGMDEIKNKKSIILYPNPTSNELFIESELAFNTIEIIDVFGILIKSIHLKTNSVNVSDLTRGVYFIQIKLETHSVIEKFIKY